MDQGWRSRYATRGRDRARVQRGVQAEVERVRSLRLPLNGLGPAAGYSRYASRSREEPRVTTSSTPLQVPSRLA
jgi:hypothetical protein